MRKKIIEYTASLVIFLIVYFVVKIAANVTQLDFHELLTVVILWMLIRVGYNLMNKIES